MSKQKNNGNHHKYLNDLGIPSTELCIFNTKETENGRETGREKRFKKQRKKYGFDERETWSMDYTLITWLYSHLKWYVKHAPINFEFHHFDIPVLEDIPDDEKEWVDEKKKFPKAYQREVLKTEVSQKDAMKLALKYMRFYLQAEDQKEDDYVKAAEIEARRYECATCALKIVAVMLPALWW